MIAEFLKIEWANFAIALPAFLTSRWQCRLLYSIANGIGIGFISYAVVE